MKFRGDIEGLRGVAVLMVVMAHANLPGFQGGFVGVDVFFVISGFLITSSLASELQSRGRIELLQFYARRVRRLVPALACMLLLSSLCAALLLPAGDWLPQSRGAYWAALWLSNIYFSTVSFGYFDSGAGGSLFLHTWSLGVEEQFYLLWPALLWCAWRWGGVRGLVICAWISVLLGFVAMFVATSMLPVHAYYQAPFRLWQLGVGAAVQLSVGRGCGTRIPTSLIRGAAALLLVLACTCFDASRIVYPGAWALIPTFGAGMLLLGGGGAGWLAWRPLRLVGRISYSWYLWHWPLLVIASMCIGNSAAVVAVMVVMSLGIAWLSWRFVELPALRVPIADGKVWVAAGLLVAALLALGANAWGRHAAKFQRDGAVPAVLRTLVAPSLYSRPDCDEWFHSDRVVPCVLVEQPGNAPRVLVVGDSVAAQWSPAFERLAEQHRWNLVVLTKSSCPMVDQPFIYSRLKRRYVECERWRDGVKEYLHHHPADLLVLGSSAAYTFTLDEWEQGTSRWLAKLSGVAPRTLILGPTPVLPFDGPRCALAMLPGKGAGGVQGLPCSAPLAQIRPSSIIERLQRGAAEAHAVRVFDPGEMVCPDGLCRAERGEMLLYRDTQHLNAPYVERLAPQLGQEPELRSLRR